MSPAPVDGRRHRRRIVIGAQVVASLGLAAGGAAGGLLAEEITGDPATAAAPLGSLVLGAGLSALPLTRLMEYRGRVTGLRTGYLAAAFGAAMVIVAAAVASLPLLLGGGEHDDGTEQADSRPEVAVAVGSSCTRP